MFKSLKDLLTAPAAPDPDPRAGRPGGRSSGDRRAPLPEVSEVDWSEWESSVFHSELDALLSGPAPLPAPTEVRELDWSVWEDSVHGELQPPPRGGKQRRE